jgi:hypothetical protein
METKLFQQAAGDRMMSEDIYLCFDSLKAAYVSLRRQGILTDTLIVSPELYATAFRLTESLALRDYMEPNPLYHVFAVVINDAFEPDEWELVPEESIADIPRRLASEAWAKAAEWQCEWCGAVNDRQDKKCSGCGHPRPFAHIHVDLEGWQYSEGTGVAPDWVEPPGSWHLEPPA